MLYKDWEAAPVIIWSKEWHKQVIGTALFASLDESLEEKVIQQLQDALKTSLSGRYIQMLISI